ncbi:hypothetical protein D9758_013059 [Tetrapyrgos nigripes]|uniref:IucC family-domain-containing protein n=1 Tax=Tetrapyrgos nigripes TaxID=182062 RepID=A0A8H5CPP2_9AGAR|nr:hypothetical protein D9758_013059 [Tetrapyrgos nigripes]
MVLLHEPLTPNERAAFAVSSRLLSCFVTESLLPAYYIPVKGQSTACAGLLVILPPGKETSQGNLTIFMLADIFAIVPLHHPPVNKGDDKENIYSRVSLVDPLDMLPQIYGLCPSIVNSEQRDIYGLLSVLESFCDINESIAFEPMNNPLDLWDRFTQSRTNELDETLKRTIRNELMSSWHWQAQSFSAPPKCPSIDSSEIIWEQSLVTGHPIHPMHRTRMLPFNINPEYDWYHPVVRFVRVPRERFDVLGPFHDNIRRLVHSGNESKSMIIPVHELQLSRIISRFPDVEVLPEETNIRADALASIRTVIIPSFPDLSVKLAVGVKISSALRTITHYTANFGPRFSQQIVPKLSITKEVLFIEEEIASAVYRAEDPDEAKHFSAILRKRYIPKPDETVIVCTALWETGHSDVLGGVSAVEHAFELNTTEKRKDFLDRYIRLALEALLPPLIHNGVAFEAHGQNALARFDSKTRQLLGFIVRDFGGVHIHPPTMKSSTEVDFEFLEGHCVVTPCIEEVYDTFYYTVIHSHLQRMIRALGMHYNGIGWEMVRGHLEKLIPPKHELRKLWLDPDSEKSKYIPGKALMKMRMQGLYRDNVYSPFPNLIFYTGEKAVEV